MGNVDIPKWLKQLPEAPEFRPTDTEFADPIAYISKIEKEASAFGICKVIPPFPKPSKKYVLTNLNKSLSRSREVGLDVNTTDVGDTSKRGVSGAERNDNEDRAVFTTRQQELGQYAKRSKGPGNMPQPAAQKQVWQSGEIYTLEQFESKSKAFSRSVLGSGKEVTPLVVEASFWKADSEKPIYVEYANDVPGSGFEEPEGLLRYFHVRKRRRRISYRMQQDGKTVKSPCNGVGLEASAHSSYRSPESGTECTYQPTSVSSESSQSTKQRGIYPNHELKGTAGWKLSNSPWNLQVIARSAGSLTRFMLDDIPGVTSPMVYIGMLFSWFAWHVEDHELHSLNFLHIGSPKTWYAVPGDYAFAFEEVIRTQAYGGDVDHLASLKRLGEKTTLLSPELVVASGIPCCRLVQNPGEFVVTFPRAYHIGFSHGFNCGEAANFCTPQWLNVAKEAAVRRAAMGQLPMLSHQQLLYLLTMSFISRVPRSLLPGVRSSRLRDRLKEERELLVKKAFIEDVLKENSLLNTLLRKDCTFRAVLWHPDSLPSFCKESLSQAGNASDAMLAKNDESLVIHDNNANQDGLSHLTSFTEAASYLDGDDISRDFQVDSGTLPCVACGILGYPFMSVVQPSKEVSMESFPAEQLTVSGAVEDLQKPESSHLHTTAKSGISATRTGERSGTSGFLRPRIFCLEHAVRIAELLRSKGGARMLVICHSDYQKIKANAAAVAEEIGSVFNYKEVPLYSASQEELNLIDVAIDGEQLIDCQEDWTSKMGINVRFTVEARQGCTSKKVEHALNLDYLLPVIASGSRISTVKWWSKKCRTKTKRESSHQKLINSCDGNPLQKDEIIHESDCSMEVKEKVILQYSRRRYRIGNYSGATRAPGCSMECSQDDIDAHCGKMDASEKDTSGPIYVKNTDAESAKLGISGCAGKYAVPHDADMPEANRKHGIEENLLSANTGSHEVTLLTEASTSTSDESNSPGTTRVDENTSEANEEDSDVENCPTASAVADLAKQEFRIGDNNTINENDSIIKASELIITIAAPEDPGSNKEKAHTKFEVCDHAASNMLEITGANETCKTDCMSTCTESTTTMEVDTPTLSKNLTDSSPIDAQASSSLVTSTREEKEKNITDAKMSSRIRGKRAKDIELEETEVDNGFIRSPCEGLRPRKKKDDQTHIFRRAKTTAATEQNPPTKKMKKSSGSSICRNKPADSKDSPHKCSLEGCKMRFKTRAELSLHKRNRCHYIECGKKFRSHKYLVLHQRVHDDERPLKCTWKGCSMSFKWAWARTEHLRLHTGERPYQCKIEGCGLTFRFVSDFSRHRRKTGHYVDASA